jgi:peptidylprolyl isomerase
VSLRRLSGLDARAAALACACLWSTSACAPARPAEPPPKPSEPSEVAAVTVTPASTQVDEEPMVTDAKGATSIRAPADVDAPPADAEVSSTGLRSKRLRAGGGDVRPAKRDHVKVHYSGWTLDGAMFDSSVVRGEPIDAPVDGLIPGFSEGLRLMVVGEQRRLWIPVGLAYKGVAGRPPGMLVFDVELIAIER